jgi:hypothetical protein
MKKYFPGLIAIIFALAFTAFTKPFAMLDYKLLQDPVADDIVNNPVEWSTGGFLFGRCDVLQSDIACTISLHSARYSYYHYDDQYEYLILNTFEYANAQVPKQDYLHICEEPSFVGSNRIIHSITPKTWNPYANGGAGGYETYSPGLGADLSFKNARD